MEPEGGGGLPVTLGISGAVSGLVLLALWRFVSSESARAGSDCSVKGDGHSSFFILVVQNWSCTYKVRWTSVLKSVLKMIFGVMKSV